MLLHLMKGNFRVYCPAFRERTKGEYDTVTATAARQVGDSRLHASRFNYNTKHFSVNTF